MQEQPQNAGRVSHTLGTYQEYYPHEINNRFDLYYVYSPYYIPLTQCNQMLVWTANCESCEIFSQTSHQVSKTVRVMKSRHLDSPLQSASLRELKKKQKNLEMIIKKTWSSLLKACCIRQEESRSAFHILLQDGTYSQHPLYEHTAATSATHHSNLFLMSLKQSKTLLPPSSRTPLCDISPISHFVFNIVQLHNEAGTFQGGRDGFCHPDQIMLIWSFPFSLVHLQPP